MQSHALTFKYGTYTGDDEATQEITGLGFDPDLVIVKAEGAYQGWMATSSMTAGDAKGMVGTSGVITGRMDAFITGGFRVGTNDEANKDGVTYHFFAFDAVSSNLAVGTFSNSSSHTVSGLSFSPEMVMMLGEGSGDNNAPVLRPDNHNDATTTWDGTNDWYDHIGSFTSDGFTTNWRTGTGTFHWVAINNSASSFENSEYYAGAGGLGDDYEVTAPGFEPDFLMVMGNKGRSPQFKTSLMADDYSLGFGASGLSTNKIQKLTSNGFEIGDDNAVNAATETFSYLAFGGGSILPVTLSKFEATAIGDKQVSIEWTTSSEINSSHFEVQRSADGINYEVIGTLNAAGQSIEQIDYSFIDYSPGSGTNFYRLRPVDLDETFEYSNVKIVQLNTSIHDMILSPNPTMDEINVNFNAEESDYFMLSIFNANGESVYSAQVMVNEGTNNIRIPMYTYDSGKYLLRVANDRNVMINQTFMKL